MASPSMADPSLCEKCGRCCYSKLIIDGEVVYTPFPCPYLDEKTRLCTVYERRHELNPQCLTVEVGIRLGVFPPDCPYVRDLPDYVPPRTRLTAEEIKTLGQDILDAQASIGEPNERRKARGSRKSARTPRRKADGGGGKARRSY